MELVLSVENGMELSGVDNTHYVQFRVLVRVKQASAAQGLQQVRRLELDQKEAHGAVWS